MSRLYGMQIKINGYHPEKKDEIIEACTQEWDFDDMFETPIKAQPDNPPELTGSAEGYLTGGESEDEFARRLTRAIWGANGEYCRVEILAAYLECIPSECYILDEDDYEKWKGTQDHAKG